MELIGKWKIKKVICMTENGMELCSYDMIPAGEDYDEYRIMFGSVFDFRPDGMAYQLLPPAEFEKLGTGEDVRLLDGMAIVEEHAWKEENGEFFYDTGMEGDIGGEPVDPYEKLEPDEDGCLPMVGGLLLIERM